MGVARTPGDEYGREAGIMTTREEHPPGAEVPGRAGQNFRAGLDRLGVAVRGTSWTPPTVRGADHRTGRPDICELPHLSVGEEDACEARRTTGQPPDTGDVRGALLDLGHAVVRLSEAMAAFTDTDTTVRTDTVPGSDTDTPGAHCMNWTGHASHTWTTGQLFVCPGWPDSRTGP